MEPAVVAALVAVEAAAWVAVEVEGLEEVREKDKAQYDIHDRVNYAVTESALKISLEKKQIALNLQIDESICTMYDYFDIFLGRMQMCRHAAELFDARFKLTANGSKVL